MFYSLREDIKIHKNLNEYYLSFIGKNLDTNEKLKCIVQINISGYEILSLCNGMYTEKGIVEELSKKYPDEDLADMVGEFLEPFIQDGLIQVTDNSSNLKSNNVLGSSDYYCPSTIMLELTNYCPLDCVHCYLGNKENKYISKNNLQKILNEIVSLGVHYVQLTGGEVLTYPHLEFAIDYLIKHHVQVNISTSGIICTDKILNILSKIKTTGGFIRVSLDGLQETHDRIRQNNNSFNNAIDFLKKAVALGIDTQVATCIINQSRSEIYGLTNLVKSIGAKQQIFERVYSQGNAKSSDLLPDYTHTEFMALLSELATEFSSNVFTIATEDKQSNENCGAGYKTYKIAYNLEVTPCIIMDYSLGNLRDESFKEIIKNNYSKYQNLKTPCRDICGDCEMIDNCDRCYAKMIQYKDKVKTCYWYKQQSTFKQEVKSL